MFNQIKNLNENFMTKHMINSMPKALHNFQNAYNEKMPKIMHNEDTKVLNTVFTTLNILTEVLKNYKG